MTGGRPEPPRLPPGLEAVRDPVLTDAAEWTGIEVRGDPSGASEVVDLDIAGARLVGLRLTGLVLVNLRMLDVVLEDCELSGVRITDGWLTRVEFRRCRLAGLTASRLKARDVVLDDCTAQAATFRMSGWERCEFRDVDLRDADFHAARLPGARFQRCDLTRVDVSKADLSGAALHRSTLDGIRGASSLRGVVVGGDQMLPLAAQLFHEMGIVVDDEAGG